VLRAGLVVIAIGLSMAAMDAGVELTERPGIPEAGWRAQLYYTLGLFVFGGLDLGLPSGGPAWARSAMWVAYFLSPTIAAGAVVEAVIRARPGWLARRRMRDHVVLVGLGRVGALYLEALRQVQPHRRVLVVDLSATRATVVEAIQRHGVYFVQGDITHDATQRALILKRAAGVVLATKDDLVNLEAAEEIAELAPRLAGHIVVHISDLALKRTLSAQLRQRRGGFPVRPEHIFNSHDISARHLVLHELRQHFALTEARDVVVIAGFGRFGQTTLEVLQSEATGEFQAVVIVDRAAEVCSRQFDEQVGFANGYARAIVNGDLDDPAIWDRVGAITDRLSPEVEPTYLLGSNVDATNLRTAMWLRSRRPTARIVVRCFSDSPFTARLARRGDLLIFGVSRLLRRSLAERHRAWFG